MLECPPSLPTYLPMCKIVCQWVSVYLPTHVGDFERLCHRVSVTERGRERPRVCYFLFTCAIERWLSEVDTSSYGNFFSPPRSGKQIFAAFSPFWPFVFCLCFLILLRWPVACKRRRSSDSCSGMQVSFFTIPPHTPPPSLSRTRRRLTERRRTRRQRHLRDVTY